MGDRKSVRKVRVYWDNKRTEGVGRDRHDVVNDRGLHLSVCSKLYTNCTLIFSEGLIWKL